MSDASHYYRSLLDLGAEDDPASLLTQALQLLVDVTEARVGYIELRDDSGGAERRWSAHVGCDDERVVAIRAEISMGIIAEALATGDTIMTASAMSDPRFDERESVRTHAIEAVICAPLGHELPLGVVYLQGGSAGLDVFADGTQRHVRYFARAIAPFLERLLDRLRPRLGPPPSGPFADVIVQSRAMQDVVERLRLVAPLDVLVLLTGPTGVGKNLLARSVHAASRRSAGPFVELNCAALPETLLENELFGAVAGAHSAVPSAGTAGKVTAAEGGTLFLDEIGELSVPSQAKLLHLLQERAYYPLGASTPRRADVRIVVATNVDLRERVAAKQIRADLYYRINVLEVRVPALGERTEDIATLAHRFATRAAETHDLPLCRLSPSAVLALVHAEWPGNVRELAHRVEAGVLNAHLRGAASVSAEDLFGIVDSEGSVSRTLQEATRRFQRRHVLSVLEETDWNIAETARQLDVVRSHVYNLIKLHGLARGS